MDETDKLKLTYKQIKNYLRKKISNDSDNDSNNNSNNDSNNDSNKDNIRNKILCLFYANINFIPIAKNITPEEYEEVIKTFPPYFKDVDSSVILHIFNGQVSPKKPINIDYKFNEYTILDNTFLQISTKTFRPVYNENWKNEAEIVNKIDYKKQISFYADYLRYYLKSKKFANYDEFLKYIYIKYKKPVHKDYDNVFKIINKSYEPIFKFIEDNKLSFNDVKKIIIQSANVKNRIEMEIK
jgi:hypothetical protein